MRSIEVIVKTDGSLRIEGRGFIGANCEKATKFLEQALGKPTGKQKKPEYHRQVKREQRIGA
jgi:hypothetical protein